jgi:hypothetical protein
MYLIAGRHGGCWVRIPGTPVFEQHEEAKAKAYANDHMEAHQDEFKGGLRAIEVHYMRDDEECAAPARNEKGASEAKHC